MPDFQWKRAAEITPIEDKSYWLDDEGHVELVSFVGADDFNPNPRFYNEDIEVTLGDNPLIFPFTVPNPVVGGTLEEREALAYDLALWAFSELHAIDTPEGSTARMLVLALSDALGPYEEDKFPLFHTSDTCTDVERDLDAAGRADDRAKLERAGRRQISVSETGKK